MIIPGLSGRRMKKNIMGIGLILVVLFLFHVGVAFSASGGEGEHGAEPKGWVATDTYRVMNFGVLALALFFILRKPVSQALGARVQSIKDQLDELELKKAEAEKKLSEYNEKIAKLEAEAENIVSEYIKQGEEAKVRILKEAENAAEKLEEQAKKNIEHEFKQAKMKLQSEITEKALEKAEALVKEKINSEDQDRLVNEYLEKVVA